MLRTRQSRRRTAAREAYRALGIPATASKMEKRRRPNTKVAEAPEERNEHPAAVGGFAFVAVPYDEFALARADYRHRARDAAVAAGVVQDAASRHCLHTYSARLLEEAAKEKPTWILEEIVEDCARRLAPPEFAAALKQAMDAHPGQRLQAHSSTRQLSARFKQIVALLNGSADSLPPLIVF